MPHDLKRALSHVYWIGGSPCSGKSTIVELLAERHAFRSYNCDDAWQRHGAWATPEAQPAFHHALHMTWDEIWMRPVEVLLADEMRIYREEWDMIVADLLSMPRDLPVVAEGAALMPHLVHPLLRDRRRAIWVVPTEGFQRQQYSQRDAWVAGILRQCADPERAFRNWMDRDAAFARRIGEDAARLGLELLWVDGRRTIAENAAIVEARLGLTS